MENNSANKDRTIAKGHPMSRPGTLTRQRERTAANNAASPATHEHGIRRRIATPPLGTISLLIVWVLTGIVFSVLEPQTFLSFGTFRSVASAQAITCIVALSLVAPIAANVFDLSIAANMGLSVVMVAALQAKAGLPWSVAVALTLVMGLLIGVINALVVVRLAVNSFIATLGMMSILIALANAITGGNQIVTGISPRFIQFGTEQILGITIPFFYMLIIALVLWYVMEYRQTGRYMYATGSNAEAARLAGVKTKRIMTIALLISALIASLAGVIFTMTIGSAAVDAGTPYLLPAFAAAFLGATQFRARRVNVPGTIIAVYVLATGIKGLQLAGAPFWVEDLFNGAALIVAVALSVHSARRRGLRVS
jgi:ribose transport system permease protein